MKIKSADFVMSNSDVTKCPKEPLPEYAFIGRSNVGKSSLINMLTERKSLAKTSGRPGKTQLINHFKINENWFPKKIKIPFKNILPITFYNESNWYAHLFL